MWVRQCSRLSSAESTGKNLVCNGFHFIDFILPFCSVDAILISARVYHLDDSKHLQIAML